jgi:ATP-binding cassette, subfamily C, bacterial PrsD
MPRSAIDPVAASLAESRRRLLHAALFSGLINLLTMSGSLYMLQVYDRVIPSSNLATLSGLTVMVVLAYVLQGYLDALRSRMLARIAAVFDVSLQAPLYLALARLPLTGARPADLQQPMRDLDQVRGFLASTGPVAFLDMPWMPLFLIVLFLFHPLIGLTALTGALAIVGVTIWTDRRTRGASSNAARLSAARYELADATRRNAEVIFAMAMTRSLTTRWVWLNEGALAESLKAMDLHANFAALGKGLRYALQSAVLAVGAYLVVKDQASGGIIIASSIMMGRALAPIEIALSSWKQMTAARRSLERLRQVLGQACGENHQDREDATPRPAIARARDAGRHHLRVENLAVAAPTAKEPIVSGVTFDLQGGMGLAVIGPSASGKSSLVRGLLGIWPACAGQVSLDGQALDRLTADERGRRIGYLPQDVQLFDGTVAENISRFHDGARPEAVVEAASIAGVHGLIAGLPGGYMTHIGESGRMLSAGQRQRIGLARALYGNPRMVVLDEPNANLDSSGETSLSETLADLRRRGSIVIVVSHRPSAVQALDMALVLMSGQMHAFGTRQDVADKLNEMAMMPARRARNSPAMSIQQLRRQGSP